MNDVLLIGLGWLFGLLSPRIVDAIAERYKRPRMLGAIKAEAKDLQYRCAVASILVRQKYVGLDKEYLGKVRPWLLAYAGNEPSGPVRDFVSKLLEAPDDQFQAVANRLRAQPDVGLSLKGYKADFLDSNIAWLHNFPIEFQQLAHEFRSRLGVVNQEADRANELMQLSWDSSLTDENHDRVKESLKQKYTYIESQYRDICCRLQAIIDYRL